LSRIEKSEVIRIEYHHIAKASTEEGTQAKGNRMTWEARPIEARTARQFRKIRKVALDYLWHSTDYRLVQAIPF
jgi:hypothetical protein